ncbi:hypothetical protein ACHAXA_008915 [Cyclostephanos tholiformis]|uniref:Uncharacterized protein n=1 Tax=Cyclostephanos tholiformis TaxID=382380 RepID=A0ABD3R3Q6_9STRA
MVFSKSLVFLALTASSTDAFAVISRLTASTSRAQSLFDVSIHSDMEQITFTNRFRDVAALSVLTFGLLFPSNDALAAQAPISLLPRDDAALRSSSIQLSATIQTMDFSLPSSYDSLSDPIASGVDELTETIVINTGGSKKIGTPTGGSSAKEQAEAARAERVAQRKATELAQSQLDKQAAKERDENIKAMRLERAAKRAAAQAEKEAAAADDAKDAKFKGVKFLDTSMPTY